MRSTPGSFVRFPVRFTCAGNPPRASTQLLISSRSVVVFELPLRPPLLADPLAVLFEPALFFDPERPVIALITREIKPLFFEPRFDALFVRAPPLPADEPLRDAALFFALLLFVDRFAAADFAELLATPLFLAEDFFEEVFEDVVLRALFFGADLLLELFEDALRLPALLLPLFDEVLREADPFFDPTFDAPFDARFDAPFMAADFFEDVVFDELFDADFDEPFVDDFAVAPLFFEVPFREALLPRDAPPLEADFFAPELEAPADAFPDPPPLFFAEAEDFFEPDAPLRLPFAAVPPRVVPFREEPPPFDPAGRETSLLKRFPFSSERSNARLSRSNHSKNSSHSISSSVSSPLKPGKSTRRMPGSSPDPVARTRAGRPPRSSTQLRITS